MIFMLHQSCYTSTLIRNELSSCHSSYLCFTTRLEISSFLNIRAPNLDDTEYFLALEQLESKTRLIVKFGLELLPLANIAYKDCCKLKKFERKARNARGVYPKYLCEAVGLFCKCPT
ncbi:unnamed protein product [Moneuplotes crassus]|uniref:Uncharacterized protein n=1 Tax=Euplotes crassus TaxID=5936 RepID=A0AAD1XD18_EUPCR|nr:unnamed protein product [Moneuplotes crassus]